MNSSISNLLDVNPSQIELIQDLWGGYGTLSRYYLNSDRSKSVIVKEINFPSQKSNQHPRGWNTEKSHLRKKKSYKVEWEWYREFEKMRVVQGTRRQLYDDIHVA